MAGAHPCRQLAEELCTIIDSVNGAYLDATLGMGTLAERLHSELEIVLDQAPHRAVQLRTEDIDYPVAYLGFAEGSEGPLHVTSAKEYRERNAPGGRNWKLLAQMCLVVIYQHWEDHFRQQFAKALEAEKDQVKLPVMGELRHLRRAIVHNAGRAVPELECNVVLPRWARDAELDVDSESIQAIGIAIKRGIRTYVEAESAAAT